jgi:hypothetical protein
VIERAAIDRVLRRQVEQIEVAIGQRGHQITLSVDESMGA